MQRWHRTRLQRSVQSMQVCRGDPGQFDTPASALSPGSSRPLLRPGSTSWLSIDHNNSSRQVRPLNCSGSRATHSRTCAGKAQVLLSESTAVASSITVPTCGSGRNRAADYPLPGARHDRSAACNNCVAWADGPKDDSCNARWHQLRGCDILPEEPHADLERISERANGTLLDGQYPSSFRRPGCGSATLVVVVLCRSPRISAASRVFAEAGFGSRERPRLPVRDVHLHPTSVRGVGNQSGSLRAPASNLAGLPHSSSWRAIPTRRQSR